MAAVLLEAIAPQSPLVLATALYSVGLTAELQKTHTPMSEPPTIVRTAIEKTQPPSR